MTNFRNGLSEKEYLASDHWFYNHLFSEDQYELNFRHFDYEVELFKQHLHEEELTNFVQHPILKILQKKCNQLHDQLSKVLNQYSHPIIWFTAYQSHTYHHDVEEIGLYQIDDSPTLYSKLLKPTIEQDIQYNYSLFSGLVGIDHHWIILVSLSNEDTPMISIRIAGKKEFCEIMYQHCTNH